MQSTSTFEKRPIKRSTYSEAAKTVAAALGVAVGISGIDHGFFEILQGNTTTPGLFVQAIGPEKLMWVNGTEDAFTIIPNFLVTGVLSILVGVAMIIWSIRTVHAPNGSRFFLGLGLLLFLVGGGIGMLAFLFFGWWVAARIHRPPALWTSFFPPGVNETLTRIRPALITAAFVFYAIALEIAITGYVPGTTDAGLCLAICWGSLLLMMGLLGLALFGEPTGRDVEVVT